ncbi:MAG: 3-oxoacyl-(Acyl-carrier-protein) reductase [Pseudomonadota bacterium]|jgi:3-oxoacyl-[acyl-carrier protein] reductase
MSDISALPLKGKNILVTGGSRGIGAAIAKHAAELGARIALTYTSKPELAETVVKSLPGEGHFSQAMDISNSISVEEGMKKILETFGTIDGLVNNAGITRDQLLLMMKTEDFDAVINTNLRGTFLVTKSVLKPMIRARKGSIVTITSIIGQTGNGGQANYAASKAGLEAFSKSVALEVASRNVRLNCVAPGFIATEMTDALTEDQKGTIQEKIPLKQIGSALDVAQAVAYLLSDNAKYVTGHTLNVNGGMFMQ